MLKQTLSKNRIVTKFRYGLHSFCGRHKVRANSSTVDTKRVIIGLGAQKSGTTWLSKVLADHPDIYMRKKEVHYWDTIRPPYIAWDSVDRILANKAYVPGAPFGANPLDHGRYLPSLELGRSRESIVCEITPAYALCSERTFLEMKGVHPDVRFVFLMRDPVSRLWSGIRHRMRAILDQPGSQVWVEKMFHEACENPYDPDFRRSRYDETLRALDKAGCRVSVLFYETLFNEKALESLCESLDVKGLCGNFDKRVNPGAGNLLRLNKSTRSHGRQALSDTYNYVAARFGHRVPEQWDS